MRRTLTLLAGAFMLVPAVLAAQEAQSKPPARETASQSTEAQARISAALETAIEAGIPVALLEQKVAEGKAKGVSMERIAAAVEARLAGLTRAGEALAEAGLSSTTSAELSVAADAVQAGVSQTALVTISESAPEDRRVVAIAVLADLVLLGRTPDRALAEVQVALQRGPAALANLRAETAAGLLASGGVTTAIPVGAEAGVGVKVSVPRRP